MAYTLAQIDAKIAALENQLDGLSATSDGTRSLARKNAEEQMRQLSYWKSLRSTVEGSAVPRQIRIYSSKGL
jgi:hypothetical protein